MAKLNPLFGRMKGKYGGSVMYSYNGKQCMRERVIEVRNPRSSKQAIQRAILATCGRFVSAFAPILNNSIQSETSKVKSLAKIRSLNMDYLRGIAATAEGQFNPKAILSIMPNDYIVSRGSLVGLNPLRSAAARTKLATDGELQFSASSLIINATATASQAFPTVAIGDQITLLAVTNNDDDEAPMVGYCRFALIDDVTPVFILDEGSNYKLNPAAVDVSKAAGNWADVVFMSDDNAIYMPPVIGDFVGDPIDLAAVIVSRESERLRSNSYAVASDRITSYPIDVAYPTYMAGGSDIDMPSEVYLNNDASSSAVSAPHLYKDGERVTFPLEIPASTAVVELGQIQGDVSIDADSTIVRYFSIGGVNHVTVAGATGTPVGSASNGHITFFPDGRITVDGVESGVTTYTKLVLVVGSRSYIL